MTHEIRQRILRSATAEERERHQQIRQQVEPELSELQQWAREAATRHRDRVAVGTVFTAQEADVVEAIDNYAATHALPSRSVVVREALSRLLGVEIAKS